MDFDFRTLGRSMPRARHQNGYLEKIGKRKTWLGHFYQYVRQSDGREKTVHKSIRLGLCSEMTKGQASDALREHIRKVESGDPKSETSDDPTVAEWYARYVAMRAPHWSPATRATFESVTERHILPAIGDTPVAAVKREALQSLLNDLGSAGWSYSLLKKVRTYLKTLFDEAIEADLISKNPARKLEFTSQAKPCKRFLTMDEVLKILAATDGRDHLIIRLALVCGLRPGELFALRVNDWEGNRLRVDESVSQRNPTQPKETKTEASDGWVHVPPPLAAELQFWIDKNPNQPEAFIFASANRTPVNPNNYEKRKLKDIGRRAGIENLTFQALRRSCATWLNKLGGPKDAQGQLRHARPDTTMIHYAQTIPESQRAAVEALDGMLNGSPASPRIN